MLLLYLPYGPIVAIALLTLVGLVEFAAVAGAVEWCRRHYDQ